MGRAFGAVGVGVARSETSFPDAESARMLPLGGGRRPNCGDLGIETDRWAGRGGGIRCRRAAADLRAAWIGPKAAADLREYGNTARRGGGRSAGMRGSAPRRRRPICGEHQGGRRQVNAMFGGLRCAKGDPESACWSVPRAEEVGGEARADLSLVPRRDRGGACWSVRPAKEVRSRGEASARWGLFSRSLDVAG